MTFQDPMWAIVLLSLAVGCGARDADSDADSRWNVEPPGRTPTWEEYLESHTTLGPDGQPTYVVLDDVHYKSVESLRALYDAVYLADTPKSVGYWSSGAPLKNTFKRMRYCVASASNWGGSDGSARRQYLRDLMARASTIWMRDLNIQLLERDDLGSGCENNNPAAGDVEFTVVLATFANGAMAFFPNAAAVDRKLFVGTGIFGSGGAAPWPPGNVDLLVDTYVHELGHTLGLNHEQGHSGWVEPVPDSTGCVTFPSNSFDLSAAPDYCSVMASVAQGCGITLSWVLANCPTYYSRTTSLGDSMGVRKLYGSPAWEAAL